MEKTPVEGVIKVQEKRYNKSARFKFRANFTVMIRLVDNCDRSIRYNKAFLFLNVTIEMVKFWLLQLTKYVQFSIDIMFQITEQQKSENRFRGQYYNVTSKVFSMGITATFGA